MDFALASLESLVVRSTALFAVALAAIAVLRMKAAATRHAVWTAVLIGMLLLAVLAPFAPPLPVRILPAAPAPVIDIPVAQPSPAVQPRSIAAHPAAQQSAPPAWQEIAVALYLTAAIVLLARLLFGYLFTRRLIRGAQPTGIGPGAVYESTWISVPMTAGCFRPKILLPAGWRRWQPDKLAAVLAHERTHVRRGDWAIAVVAGINRCIFWIDPLAWWLERNLASLAEHACDDEALLLMESRESYAQALLDMAAAARTARGRLVWEAMAMAKASEVRMRLDRILDETRQIPRALGRRRWALLAACSLPLIYSAAVLQIEPALAQSQGDQKTMAAASPEWPDLGKLTPSDANRMEQQLLANPDDLQTRSKLIAYYFLNNVREPRLSHIFWLVEHHPESEIAAFNSTGISPRSSTLNTSADYDHVAGLWRQQVAADATDPKVLMNAAQFFAPAGGDWSRAEELLKQARDLQPNNFQATQKLATLYARALQAAPAIPDPAFAAHARSELENSTDTQLLVNVASLLMTVPQDATEDVKRALQPRIEFGLHLRARAEELGAPTAQLPLSPMDQARLQALAKNPPPVPLTNPPAVLSKVDPEFPAAAREARISGIVRLNVTIGTDGHVTGAGVMMGHPLLAQPALAAVRQWIFAPVLQNGAPVAARFPVDIPMSWNGGPVPPPVPPRPAVAAQPKPPIPSRIRVGGNVQSHMLIDKVNPVYPEQARTAGPDGTPLEGTVTVTIIIGDDGRVQSAEPTEGHPLLAAAAVEAVKQWVYKPTLLNGNPVQVQTTADVPFSAK